MLTREKDSRLARFAASSPPLNANNNLITSASASEYQTASVDRNLVSILKSTSRQKYAEGVDPTVLNLVSPSSLKNREIFSKQIQPFQGRNPCMERNLVTKTKQRSPSLIDKSQKHSFVSNGVDFSMSRLEHDVSVDDLISNIRNNCGDAQTTILGEGIPKQNNSDRILTGWYGVRAMIQKKLFRKHPYTIHDDEKLSNLDRDNQLMSIRASLETNNELANVRHRNVEPAVRPNNLDIQPLRNNNVMDRLRSDDARRIRPDINVAGGSTINNNDQPAMRKSTKSNSTARSLNNFEMLDDETSLKRQRSLEVFRDVFGAKGSIERLRNPSQRVKTPGDVPPSVRKVRASKTLSLYDDRMMDLSNGVANIL